MVARVAQGIATGAAMTALGATLVDLNPPHSPGRAGVVNSVAPIAGLALDPGFSHGDSRAARWSVPDFGPCPWLLRVDACC
jgi:MFS family permease